jgi:hypothetical protein
VILTRLDRRTRKILDIYSNPSNRSAVLEEKSPSQKSALPAFSRGVSSTDRNLEMRIKILFSAVAIGTFAAVTAFAGAPTASVTKDTYGVFNKTDFPVVLRHDQATIEALIAQHKCILVPKGTEGILLDENPPPKSVVFRPATNQAIEVILLASDISVDGKPLEEDSFQASDLPRVPIHTPRRRPSNQEEGAWRYHYNQQHPNDPIPLSISTEMSIYPIVEEAICHMFHVKRGDWFNNPKPFVRYGPVKEGDHWFFEVEFQFPDDSYVLPAKKMWTAVLRQSADGKYIISCELGEDTPSLREGQFPPPPAAQTKVFDTKIAIERLLDPRKSIVIPPTIPLGEVTILEDTIGMVDDATDFDQFITAQYFNDTKTLDALFENGKAALIKKGTQVLMDRLDYGSHFLDITFKGEKIKGASGPEGWSNYHLYLPYSALLKELSHPTTYVPKSDKWIISNKSQEHWLKSTEESPEE